MSLSESLFQHHTVSDESEESVSSLSAYIAAHLKNQTHKTPVSPVAKPTPSETGRLFSIEGYNAFQQNKVQRQGRVLHHLDAQLANNHLERYLPTASTRCQIMHARLKKELLHLNQQLTQYRQFTGNEYQDKIESLEQRIDLVAYRVQELDTQLGELNPFEGTFQKVKTLTQKVLPQSPFAFVPDLNPLKTQTQLANQQLAAITDILADELHDPSFSAEQLGRLVNQYDSNLKKVEKLMNALQNKPSLGQTVCNKVLEWVSHK